MAKEIRVKIEGLNLSRIIDYLVSQGVILNRLIQKSKCVFFSINENCIEKLNKICEFECKKYIVISKNKIINILAKCKYYFGLIVAFLLIFCYLFSYQTIIFRVNVLNESNINYDLNQVYDLLENNKISVGSNKLKFKNYEIKKLILNSLEGISNCSVYYNGNILNVKIYPEKEQYVIDNGGLYSKYDAVITDFDIYSGDSNFKVGSVVKVGDLLVKFNDSAHANVKGKVYFSETMLFNERQQKMIFTGKNEKVKNVYLCNKLLIKQVKDIDYSNYLVKKCDFYINKDYLIPIKIEEIIYEEYEIQEEILKFENVENELKKNLHNEVIKKIPRSAEIKNITYSVVRDGELVRLDCFVEAIVDLI